MCLVNSDLSYWFKWGETGLPEQLANKTGKAKAKWVETSKKELGPGGRDGEGRWVAPVALPGLHICVAQGKKGCWAHNEMLGSDTEKLGEPCKRQMAHSRITKQISLPSSPKNVKLLKIRVHIKLPPGCWGSISSAFQRESNTYLMTRNINIALS